ncbi:MAG TPA: TIGR02206 family membrane protein [Nocardioidaceae bacterium]|nr:TIGR02206 family membrane protein [Nocardioidaceae bacterium]
MTPLAGFDSFTYEHLGLVSGFLLVCVVIVLIGRSHRGTDRELAFRRGFAIAIPCILIPLQIPQLLPGDFDAGKSLPLQLCDLAWIAAIYALWTRNPFATALVYFWGLTLTVQGIVTPSLGETFPDTRYFMFWSMHFLTVWAAVYLTFGLRVPVNWRTYRFAVAATAGWAVTVMVINELSGTNYGYLNEKPSSGSVLDLMGPWPVYVVVEVGILIGLWALMTWPWVRSAGRAGREPLGERRVETR